MVGRTIGPGAKNVMEKRRSPRNQAQSVLLGIAARTGQGRPTSSGILALKILIAAFALLILALVLLFVLKKRVSSDFADTPWPLYAKKPLTQAEQVLYHRLVATLPECIVLAQVQLSRVLGVKSGFNFNQWNNRINRMSLDFLVCLKDSTIVAAVELDDKTHEKAARAEADEKKEKALSAAGVALIRWRVSELPDEAAIRQVFAR
jgi:very-short-patch-repair endonuclease